MLKKWKKGALLAAAAIMVAAFAASCSSGDDDSGTEGSDSTVTSITLNAESLTLALSPVMEGQLTATVSPKDAEVTVKWSSSNEEIATVDQTGKVTPVKAGTATITAEVDGKKATCAVTVNNEIIAVESVTLDKKTLSLKCGADLTLVATVLPAEAVVTATWSTSDESVATVKDGKVTVVTAGETTITARAGEKSATCKVTVSHQYNKDGKCTCGKERLVMPYATINDNDILTKYSGKEKAVAIVKGVKGIAQSAFQSNTDIESVEIPDSVTSVGNKAFYECTNLKSVTIGNGVTSIGEDAFRGDSKLESVTISASVTKIGPNAFYGCDNHNVTYTGTLAQWCSIGGQGVYSLLFSANSVVLAGENNFELKDKDKEELEIPAGVTSIGDYVFTDCKLESVTIPASVTSIGKYPFYSNYNLKTITYTGTEEEWKKIKLHADSGLTINTTITVSGGKTLKYNSSTRQWE